MRTSMFLATMAAVGAASAGCAQGSRQAAYRTVNEPRVAAPGHAPAVRPAPYAAAGPSRGTVVLSSRPAPARIVPAPVPSRACAPPAPVFAQAPAAQPQAPVFQPVVAAPSAVFAPLPFAPSSASIGGSGRPVNATCPVMLGNPVDPAVTAVYQGRVIAFSDYTARWKWNTAPDRYASNLPRMASGSSSDTIPVTGIGPVTSGPVFATRGNEPLPLDPTLPSFDALPPVRSTPTLPPPSQLPAANAAVTAPRVMPPAVSRTPGPVVKGPTLRLPGTTSPAKPPAACAPSLDLTHDEDEECPGGNCRLPGR